MTWSCWQRPLPLTISLEVGIENFPNVRTTFEHLSYVGIFFLHKVFQVKMSLNFLSNAT